MTPEHAAACLDGETANHDRLRQRAERARAFADHAEERYRAHLARVDHLQSVARRGTLLLSD
jgi:hypothetical protein